MLIRATRGTRKAKVCVSDAIFCNTLELKVLPSRAERLSDVFSDILTVECEVGKCYFRNTEVLLLNRERSVCFADWDVDVVKHFLLRCRIDGGAK
jgi:hypothetical protein